MHRHLLLRIVPPTHAEAPRRDGRLGSRADRCVRAGKPTRTGGSPHTVGIGMAKVVALDGAPRRTRLGRPPGSTGSQIERNKHRLAFLVVQGKRNIEIAREFGVSSRTIRTWLNDPQVHEEIKELEADRHRSTERLLAGLFRASIRRTNKIIRHGESKVALRAIELFWNSSGLLQKAGPETNVLNRQQMLLQPNSTGRTRRPRWPSSARSASARSGKRRRNTTPGAQTSTHPLGSGSRARRHTSA